MYVEQMLVWSASSQDVDESATALVQTNIQNKCD